MRYKYKVQSLSPKTHLKAEWPWEPRCNPSAWKAEIKHPQDKLAGQIGKKVKKPASIYKIKRDQERHFTCLRYIHTHTHHANTLTHIYSCTPNIHSCMHTHTIFKMQIILKSLCASMTAAVCYNM